MSPFGLGRRPALIAVAAVVAVAVAFGLLQRRQQPRPLPQGAAANASRPAAPPALEAVSALGRLEPAGDIRKLAAPVTDFGASPRLTGLYVQEGQRVRAGQVLASFDNRPTLLAQENLLLTRIASLRQQLELLDRETSRYRQLTNRGVFAIGALEAREIKVVDLRGDLQEAKAELLKVRTDLAKSQLLAPIAGLVLRINTHPGERPGEAGILEIGANDQMEAVAEVYESDISRVRLGQSVTLTSENGGFQGSLAAKVVRISPQVRQRQVLSTDPTGDADARVVEVRLALGPAEIQRVRQLAGLKIIARFTP
ncbi:MAG: HlyD family efflux transporter periplasmic adaptor subunit [Cyanobacteria bacterium]|nr:HlyD family efflux transporter periplasmic adaptor subunit [Cyanobacteriota bacterium]